MQKFIMYALVFIAASVILMSPAAAETVTTKWGGDAEMVYDTGFMHMLMKHPGGGVSLFNMDLVQNDAPGSGYSEKGVSRDSIWGKNRARKLFTIDDPRAHKAWLVTYASGRGKYPLQFTVNGKQAQFDIWTNNESYRWAEFPAEWLKKGRNTIDFFCPEASTEKEGWGVQIARADEFEAGGGDPADVGKTSISFC